MQPRKNTTTNHLLEPEQWVARYADALYGYVCSRITDTIVAQDIVQDIFLSAWNAREGYKGDSSEKNWLFAICKNKIIDYYRKEAKEIVTQLSAIGEDAYFDDSGHWNNTHLPKEWNADYNQTIEKKEFYSILEQCKNRLQELQRAVFALKYMDDMESDEICKELAITPSNYWVLMHRAKLQMRACLEKNWFDKK